MAGKLILPAKYRPAKQCRAFQNYYQAVCPNGIHNVRTYSDVIYKDIYSNIDLHYYQRNGNLKYDYLVAPFANYKQIRMKINGSMGIEAGQDGSVIISTLLGEIKEAAPLVFQNGKQLPSKWIIEGNELSFFIEGYDQSQPLVIDPIVRSWGTYYGGSGTDEAKGCATDATGMCIWRVAAIPAALLPQTGSFKATLSGSGYDAFLVKFNTSGVRQWATYYGGAGDDAAAACITDQAGNVYLTGQVGSASTAGIATAGTAQQGSYGGGTTDAFLVKFNSSGTRLWATYYGGSGTDQGEGLAIDPSNSDIYMSGFTGASTSANVIATTGAHQTTFWFGIPCKV